LNTLDLVKVNQPVVMLGFHQQNNPIRHKLLAMGFVPGVRIKVIRIAPLGDPILIELRGYTLTLRKKECQLIEVENIAEIIHE